MTDQKPAPPPKPAYPRYRCHKVVEAFKIGDIEPMAEGHRLYPEEDGLPPVDVDYRYVRRNNPERGGYYVRYSDGYESFSPARAFEEGYSLDPAASTGPQDTTRG